MFNTQKAIKKMIGKDKWTKGMVSTIEKTECPECGNKAFVDTADESVVWCPKCKRKSKK